MMRFHMAAAIGATARMVMVGLAVVLGGGVFAAPVSAFPFSNCDQARAAGAAPIYAGQPGYSSKLDGDGDGVACETGGGGGGPALPAMPSMPPSPAMPGSPVIPPAAAGHYTTIVTWSDTPCVEVVVPNYSEMLHQNLCYPEQAARLFHTAAPGQTVGADPIMGAATAIACSVIRDSDGAILFEDRAIAGDGSDVNCIITV
jgi:hypothetical protein